MRSKQAMRKIAAARLRDITPEYASAAAVQVAGVLLTLPEMASASVVALYSAMTGEIDLEKVCLALNRQGKETLFPRYNKPVGVYDMVPVSDPLGETRDGHYGIREPLPGRAAAPDSVLNHENTLWCVPALAFDVSGNRLGRGGGYYDRLLESTRGVKVGIAFETQIFAELPADAHDTPMDLIVTEQRCLRCSRKAA
ncbi:MAG: 5-formyltetrahydrofolate cyclo-ligase [Lentisphaeria bacterium]|nr:5-formyltetrahydrofolate cyclo-ligase [Lentisphaeria bacterium]